MTTTNHPRWTLSGFKASLVLVVCTALAAGTGCCVVGPDSTSPAPPILQNQFHGAQWAQPDASLSSAAWWNYFSDDVLNNLISQVQTQNLSLRQSYERIVEARSNLLLQGGQLLPNGDLIGEYAYSKNSANARPFVAANSDPFDLFRLGFDSRWELDLFGKIKRSIEAADSELKLQQYEYEYLRQTLMSDVAVSYLRIRLLQDQIILVEGNLGIQNETLSLVRQRGEAGVSTELDAKQTEAFRFRTQAALSSLQQQVELEFNQIAILLGQVPNAKLKMDIGVRQLPQIPVMPQFGVPAKLLMLRPDVKREEMAVRAATSRIGVAQADLYPQISLLGSISVSAKSVSALFETNGLAFSVGPSFSWNILHFNRIHHNIDIQQARLRQALLKYQETVLSAVREVEDSLISQEGFQRQWSDLNQAVAADQKSVELSLQRYKAGKANFQRVLDAQQQLLNDQQLLVQAQNSAITETVRLFRAAGGWSFARLPANGCSNCNQTSCGCNLPAAAHSNVVSQVPFNTGSSVDQIETMIGNHWEGQTRITQPIVNQQIVNQTVIAPDMPQPVVTQQIGGIPVGQQISGSNVVIQANSSRYPLNVNGTNQSQIFQLPTQRSITNLPEIPVEQIQIQPPAPNQPENWLYGNTGSEPLLQNTTSQGTTSQGVTVLETPLDHEIEPFSIDFEALENLD